MHLFGDENYYLLAGMMLAAIIVFAIVIAIKVNQKKNPESEMLDNIRKEMDAMNMDELKEKLSERLKKKTDG